MGVVLKHLYDNPPPPSSLRPELPPALDKVVLQALSKEPAERHSSASALAQALQAAWPQGRRGSHAQAPQAQAVRASSPPAFAGPTPQAASTPPKARVVGASTPAARRTPPAATHNSIAAHQHRRSPSRQPKMPCARAARSTPSSRRATPPTPAAARLGQPTRRPSDAYDCERADSLWRAAKCPRRGVASAAAAARAVSILRIAYCVSFRAAMTIERHVLRFTLYALRFSTARGHPALPQVDAPADQQRAQHHQPHDHQSLLGTFADRRRRLRPRRRGWRWLKHRGRCCCLQHWAVRYHSGMQRAQACLLTEILPEALIQGRGQNADESCPHLLIGNCDD